MEARIVTLEELERNYDELGLINEKQEKRVRYIERETTKIVISYVFLQALIYLSNNIILIASNANHIRAHDCERSLWAPFSLSLPFGITFAAKAYEFDVNLAGPESILYKMSSLRQKRDNDRFINAIIDSGEIFRGVILPSKNTSYLLSSTRPYQMSMIEGVASRSKKP